MTDWRTRALCLDSPEDMFHPLPADQDGQAAAIAVCQSCPVIYECRQEGARTGSSGVWGGIYRPDQHQAKIRPPDCPEPSGKSYYRHVQRRETPCQACVDAERTERQARRERREQRTAATA